MKTRTLVILLSFALLLLSYIFYSSRLNIVEVKDASAQESFQLYKKTNSRPANIDLIIDGEADSTFAIKVVGLPSRVTLFDSSFDRKKINYKCKIDYYEGDGAEIFYTPKGVVSGDVKISSRINSDF